MILKKAMLIIDRGSRESEVKEELSAICELVKKKVGMILRIIAFLK